MFDYAVADDHIMFVAIVQTTPPIYTAVMIFLNRKIILQ